ncbi:mannose-6-phosphate isomerase, class I [Vibrio sp. 10N.261.51.F12]|uniref:mannose-6-phosphate isomerase, class I n=1 Tax=Vibrio sp. 10N.261.51.F12 TaxID=3229679 RepID=UPI003550F620
MTTASSFFLLDNTIQHYPWGSTTSIPELFNVENTDKKPMAEIWMGAHPKASSTINVDGEPVQLCDYIKQHGANVLGEQTQQQFGELPYLFKVLAAAQALSIQVHPTKQEAEIGFAKENANGIVIDAYNRNYKDPNHKPELVYALTTYYAMNGFRSYSSILEHFKAVDSRVLSTIVEQYAGQQNAQGLRTLFEAVLTLSDTQRVDATDDLLNWAHADGGELATFILELNEYYPKDVGLLSPLMLNVVVLQPGEAMYLDAGTPHAYVRGTALELMANSDNVLRAGLTPKYIDVPELLASCRFEPLVAERILTTPTQEAGRLDFVVPVSDFAFSVYPQSNHQEVAMKRAEIWFAIDEDATFESTNDETITIKKGQSVFIPISTQTFTVTSLGTVARAH